MFLKTRVKNLTDTARNIRWIARGMHFGAGQEILVDGAYPTACVDAASLKQLQAELASKSVSITLVTDIPVESCNALPVVVPVVVVEAPVVEKVKPLEPITPVSKLDEKRFALGPLESFRSEEKRVDGITPEAVKVPEDKALFTDAPAFMPKSEVQAKEAGKRAAKTKKQNVLSEADRFAKSRDISVSRPNT